MSEYAGIEKPICPRLGQRTLDLCRQTYARLQQLLEVPDYFDRIEESEQYGEAMAAVQDFTKDYLDDPMAVFGVPRPEAVTAAAKPLFDWTLERVVSKAIYEAYIDQQQALLKGILVGRCVELTWPDANSIVATCVDVYASDALMVIKHTELLGSKYASTGTKTQPESQSIYMVGGADIGDALVVSQLKFLPERD